MTPAELRRYCERFHDEHGTGGQTRLAELLGWSDRTMRRKLVGDTPIGRDEELAIRCLAGCGPAAPGPKAHLEMESP